MPLLKRFPHLRPLLPLAAALAFAACHELVAPSPDAPPARPLHTVVGASPSNIGTLGGSATGAYAINAAGLVVGLSATAGDESHHAFAWTAGAGIRDLGGLGGESSALAVNSRGQAAGFGWTTGSVETREQHALLWDADGTIRDLGTLGGRFAVALFVSEDGEVFGQSTPSGGTEMHLFRWTSRGGMEDLNALDGRSATPTAINVHGAIVGYTDEPFNGGRTAFMWTPASGMQLFTGLGFGSAALAINSSGNVAGEVKTAAGGTRAVLWSPSGGMLDLDTPAGTDTRVTAINDHNTVIGSVTLADGTYHACRWRSGPPMQDLGVLPGHAFSNAVAINDLGEIVGVSISGDGNERRAVLFDADGIEDLFPSTGLTEVVAITNDETVLGYQTVAHLTVVPNRPPTASPISIATLRDASVDVMLAGTDPDGDALTYAVGTPLHGTLSGSPPSLVYTPDAGYVGQDEFTYTVTDAKHLSSAPGRVTISVERLAQTIAFTSTAPTAISAGHTYLPTAVATSGLPVAFGTLTPDVCEASGGVVHLIGAGTCTVTADQGGDANYAPAPQQTQSFAVARAAQTIAFQPEPPPTGTVGGTLSLGATATSGGPVAFSSLTPAVCSVSGGVLTFDAAGTCTVAADQPGTAAYLPAPQATRTITVGPAAAAKAPQTVHFTSLAPGGLFFLGYGFNVSARASSNLPVTLSIAPASAGVCRLVNVSGNSARVEAIGLGTCTVSADQPGDATFAPATPATMTFTIVKLQSLVLFVLPPTRRFGTTLALTSVLNTGSHSPVVYTSLTPGVCTVSGTTATLVDIGICTIAANKAGDAQFAAAPQVTASTRVIWDWNGFIGRVTPPSFNSASAAGPVNLTFSIGDHGLNILASGSPTVAPVSCATGQRLATDSPAQGTLTYDGVTDRYTYAWQPTLAPGTCARVTVTLRDQTTHAVQFTLQ